MKIRFRTILLALFAALSVVLYFSTSRQPEVTEAPMDFDAAVHFLASNKPVPIGELGTPVDPVIRERTKKRVEAAVTLAHKEMQALEVIHEAHRPVDLDLMFSYASFTLEPFYGTSATLRYVNANDALKQAMDDRRHRCPILSVILDMPGAAQALQKYASDARNPINYRLDALQILQYVDKSSSKTIAAKLMLDTAGDTVSRRAVIEAETKTGFEGGIDVDRMSAEIAAIPK